MAKFVKKLKIQDGGGRHLEFQRYVNVITMNFPVSQRNFYACHDSPKSHAAATIRGQAWSITTRKLFIIQPHVMNVSIEPVSVQCRLM